MNKKKKIFLILIPLLLIGSGIFALTRKKKSTPIAPVPKKKKGTIIIGEATGGIDPFLSYPAGNYFFVKIGAEMWSYPSTIGSDLIRTYQYEDSVLGLQTGVFNGEAWIQVDDFDNVGWIRESDLFQKENGSIIEF